MRKKETTNLTAVDGFYVKELTQGFFGEHNEGKFLLNKMGLSPDELPFSAVVFLRKRKIHWYDKNGHRAVISFRLKPNQLECFGTYLVPKDPEVYEAELQENPKAGKYLQKQKSLRLFREWGNHEDPEVIARLESEAIGDCCMQCIYQIITKKDLWAG